MQMNIHRIKYLSQKCCQTKVTCFKTENVFFHYFLKHGEIGIQKADYWTYFADNPTMVQDRSICYTTASLRSAICVYLLCSIQICAVKFEQGHLYRVGTFIVNSDKRISSCVNAATLLRDICVISAIVRNKMPEVVKGRTFIKFMGAKSECWDNAIAVGFC